MVLMHTAVRQRNHETTNPGRGIGRTRLLLDRSLATFSRQNATEGMVDQPLSLLGLKARRGCVLRCFRVARMSDPASQHSASLPVRLPHRRPSGNIIMTLK